MRTGTQHASAQLPSCVPRALRYRHRYLQDETFDNIYITRRFRELDQLQAEQGKPTVLPLTAQECGRYISPGQPHARGHPQVNLLCPEPGFRSLSLAAGPWLSRKEHHQYGLQLVGFLRHMLLGFCIILADYSLFWLLDLIRHQLQGEIVARGEQHPLCQSSTLGYFAAWGTGLWGGGCSIVWV